MLVLTRMQGERIVIDDDIVITICQISDNHVRVGIDAPKDVRVHREEVYRKLKRNSEK